MPGEYVRQPSENNYIPINIHVFGHTYSALSPNQTPAMIPTSAPTSSSECGSDETHRWGALWGPHSMATATPQDAADMFVACHAVSNLYETNCRTLTLLFSESHGTARLSVSQGTVQWRPFTANMCRRLTPYLIDQYIWILFWFHRLHSTKLSRKIK